MLLSSAPATDRAPSVRIVYHHFPHYRQGFIDALAQSRYRLSVQVGEEESIDGIASATIPQNVERLTVKNMWLTRRILWQRGLLQSVLRDGVDIYIFLANPNFLSTWLAAASARLLGKRVIFWGHGFLKPRQRLHNAVRRVFFSLANCFYSYGFRSKEIALLHGFNPRNLYVGFNSLNTENQQRIFDDIEVSYALNPLRLFRRQDCIKLVCVSRLTPECCYELLIEALRLAKHSYGQALEVVFIGDGPCRRDLEHAAVASDVDIRFLGAIYDEPLVARWFYEADATVSPGKIGLTAMHSLAYGTPVVSHSTLERQMPEIEAVVDGYSGLLFDIGDATSLAKAIAQVPTLVANREVRRAACRRVIFDLYNPTNQRKIMEQAIEGIPATFGDDARRFIRKIESE